MVRALVQAAIATVPFLEELLHSCDIVWEKDVQHDSQDGIGHADTREQPIFVIEIAGKPAAFLVRAVYDVALVTTRVLSAMQHEDDIGGLEQIHGLIQDVSEKVVDEGSALGHRFGGVLKEPVQLLQFGLEIGRCRESCVAFSIANRRFLRALGGTEISVLKFC